MNRIMNRISKTILLAMASMLILTAMSMNAAATTAQLSGDPGTPPWWKSDVQVTLSPPALPPGAKTTYYCIDIPTGTCAGGGDPTKYKVYSGPFKIGAQGVNINLYYYSTTEPVGLYNDLLNIDWTKPTIVGTPTPAANANGWHNSDVTISYTCGDGGPSGLAGPCPADDHITTDGVWPFLWIIWDNAGNQGTYSTTIKLDKTPPTVAEIQGRVNTLANNIIETFPGHQDYWFRQNVIVNIEAIPPSVGSGVDTIVPSQKTLTEIPNVQGHQDQTVSAEVTDKAGNKQIVTLTTFNIHGSSGSNNRYVNIDKTKPVITVTGVEKDKYYNVPNVDPDIKVVDPNLRSVTATLDGNPYDYINSPPISGEGKHTLEIKADDIVGNTELQTIPFTIDTTKPKITHTRNKAANANDWYNTDIVVTFKATDESGDVVITSGGLTGVNTLNVPVTTEGKDQSVSATATDKAGNTAGDKDEHINIDKTPPIVDGSPLTLPNVNGWYNTHVTVRFTVSDALSGPELPSTFDKSSGSNEGANVIVSGTGKDLAGNEKSKDVSLNIDLTPPVITTNVENGKTYTEPVTPTINIDGAVSGIKTQSITLNDQPFASGTTISTNGLYILEALATDNAGNNANLRKTFNVNINGPPPPPPPPPSPTVKKATGAGSIASPKPNKIANFDFQAKIKDGTVSGYLKYTDTASNIRLTGGVVKTLTFADDTAIFTGIGKVGIKTVNFKVTVKDNGTPGKNNDIFKIEITGPSLNYKASGKLKSGNIKVIS